ncbi:hypothetical protein P7D85_14575 [Enterococcus hulanensis]|uniref:Uncharacterized protein n=1 Tax=Enterococcus hulanensis TaxID=2559929 RepID=A0ABU3F3A9_9ENTE|nr:hypothetical protein [Enterococcus hulanensis]MDT2601008.1 hypothetical protein [Enterococcus hulanensis]MDT2610510.1 hypothetical protein [Enterococcus hulanensis]MDT2617237.1 hypothetical protein [Enterococcus hulanensis]
MSIEFKPTIKAINIASEDLTKITLEVKNGSLDGQYEDLRKLSGKTVVVAMLPDHYSYTQKFDRSTNKPVQEWIVNPDGTAEMKETEQTQLDVDGKGNIDIREIEKKVDKDLIDEYIMKSNSIEFPGIINPRDVISRLDQGDDLGEVADAYEMSDAALLAEIEKARKHFAPFADAWNKVRDEVVFQDADETDLEVDADSAPSESDSDEPEEETMNQSEETENVSEDETESKNEQPENEDSESDNQSGEDDPEDDDPYK